MREKPLRLVVRRLISAPPERLFEAWTTPSQLRAWWGPRGVRCTHAEIDARVGGRYRIDNELPDGSVVTITGEFLVIEPPIQLVYTWATEPSNRLVRPERVMVRFEPRELGTEVVVIHERILDERKSDQHEVGWSGCLDGLETHIAKQLDPAGGA